MRFNLRLIGQTDAGRKCFMEASVHASSQQQLMDEAHKMASAVFHSRTWKALVGASDVVLRLTGRGGHRSP